MPAKTKWRRRPIGPIPPFEVMAFEAFRKAANNDRLMMALTPVLKPFNAFHPVRYENPYGLYETLAESGPVVRHPIARSWLISGFAETEEALRLSEASADRTELIEIFPPYNKLSAETRSFFKSWILSMDPPDHTRIRKLVSRAFTPRSMQALEPRVAEIAASLIADASDEDAFDVVQTFGNRFPIFVIGEMLGLPESDWPWLKKVSDVLARFVDPMVGFDPVEMDTMASEIAAYMRDAIEQRRDTPSDDLIGRLVSAEEDGDTLTELELMSLIALVMVAGHETTTNFFGNSLVALAEYPDQRALLASQPGLIENAVEELLRYDSPVQVTSRTLTGDATIGGQLIKAGSELSILLGAANRDTRQFENPETLMLDREDPRSLSFGHGIHHCVGAALARMEARVALPLLLDDLGEYTIDEVEWSRSFTLRGPSKLIVRRS